MQVLQTVYKEIGRLKQFFKRSIGIIFYIFACSRWNKPRKNVLDPYWLRFIYCFRKNYNYIQFYRMKNKTNIKTFYRCHPICCSILKRFRTYKHLIQLNTLVLVLIISGFFLHLCTTSIWYQHIFINFAKYILLLIFLLVTQIIILEIKYICIKKCSFLSRVLQE